MCGRFCITFSYNELLAYFNLVTGKIEPRYNVAPSQEIPAVRLEKGARKLTSLRWGLVPSWSKEPAPGFSTINARSETAHTSPAFRSAFRHRRCLIPASGFFEWKREGTQKQPWYIHRKDGPWPSPVCGSTGATGTARKRSNPAPSSPPPPTRPWPPCMIGCR